MRRRELFNIKKTGTLKLSASSGTAAASSGSYVTFTVKYNDVALTDENVVISSTQTWVTKTWTASTSTVKLSCTSNTDLNNSRSAIITVTYDGASASYTLYQSKGTLSLSSYSASGNYKSGSTTFNIQINNSNYSGTATVSSNQTWATTSKSGSTVTVSYTENDSGNSRSATITVTCQSKTQTFTFTQGRIMIITSLPYDGTINGYKYITINNVKWAINNVGATSDGDGGLFFQWGDTQGYTAAQIGSGSGKKYFAWPDYKYGDGTSSPTGNSFTKYNPIDNKTTLDSSDDAATVNMGSSWRTPTYSELSALGNAIIDVGKFNSIYGSVFTDSNNSSKFLFIPWAGKANAGAVYNNNTSGSYWTSTLRSDSDKKTARIGLMILTPNLTSGELRYMGDRVRAISS